jgi:hypothetical protein
MSNDEYSFNRNLSYRFVYDSDLGDGKFVDENLLPSIAVEAEDENNFNSDNALDEIIVKEKVSSIQSEFAKRNKEKILKLKEYRWREIQTVSPNTSEDETNEQDNDYNPHISYRFVYEPTLKESFSKSNSLHNKNHAKLGVEIEEIDEDEDKETVANSDGFIVGNVKTKFQAAKAKQAQLGEDRIRAMKNSRNAEFLNAKGNSNLKSDEDITTGNDHFFDPSVSYRFVYNGNFSDCQFVQKEQFEPNIQKIGNGLETIICNDTIQNINSDFSVNQIAAISNVNNVVDRFEQAKSLQLKSEQKRLAKFKSEHPTDGLLKDLNNNGGLSAKQRYELAVANQLKTEKQRIEQSKLSRCFAITE